MDKIEGSVLRSPADVRGFADFDGPLYYVPTGFIDRADDPQTLPLAGGRRGFSALEIIRRRENGGAESMILPLLALEGWVQNSGRVDEINAVLDRLTGNRRAFANQDMDSSHIMGIVNVTPDSFSDGGEHNSTDQAIAHGRALAGQGASILDIGGESTRPGAAPVSIAEEIDRVVPVIQALADDGHCVSVDTRHAGVMAAAIEAGAHIINDVTALAGDEASLELVAQSDKPVILMHMQGEPGTMQDHPSYECVVLDVYDYLLDRVESCEQAGISRDRICVDPGIGFGKSLSHNLELLSRLSIFHGLGCPVLLGASRKSFIGKIDPTAAPQNRLGGSLAAALNGWRQGMQIVRVHDVAQTAQAVSIASAMGTV
ncbi:dihydropteroate synthase [Thalassospira mesophila]|uniref:Dihydropteroate synthase n=1 Tax=Thalassospira mesophila TaxID=1293891 RepID=A0A1Y2L2F7_9PROT|nr:dihydropteroate synthase [Thalassospira mesophila]OSQ38762.1 dihydropteroate synthase [Thalassospira mesophila]